MPVVMSPEATPAREKKHKKVKSEKSEKKRVREEDAAADGERKHKKSKSMSADAIVFNEDPTGTRDIKTERKRKKKKEEEEGTRIKQERDVKGQDDAVTIPTSEKKKKKKNRQNADSTQTGESADFNGRGSTLDKKEKKKKKKKKHAEITENGAVADETMAQPATRDTDEMDIDQPSSAAGGMYQPPDIPANPQFPFFRQTVSLYEPIYPNGWAQPVTNAQYQHLQRLQNKYVPSLKGVLLDYKNVTLGPVPSRDGAAADDETQTTLISKNEYAVGFGWITADVELFVPSRGAWMEGSVNLQTEGHIGMVCFGKFNASIETSRLPPSWKWVSNESPKASGFEETASVITADDHGVAHQIHSTGFWIDGSGQRIKGKIRFRIRNFDAGTSGENSYLSLEGTMLDKASEKKLLQEEARLAQVRREKRGGRKIERRRAPDFSMTRFAPE